MSTGRVEHHRPVFCGYCAVTGREECRSVEHDGFEATGSGRGRETVWGVHVLQALDADAVRRWSRAAADALESHRLEIDDLNVFPVPDGDTGTNMAVTVRAGADALAAANPDRVTGPGAALAEFARGAVLAARGNSGVILAQLLRGIADAADDGAEFGRAQFSAGLSAGVTQAYTAVADPVEGTILTVARAAAAAADDESAGRPAASELPPAGGGQFARQVQAVVRAAQTALGHTPEQLPALARAGVVDAGGRGLVLLLDALARTVTGGPSLVPDVAPSAPAGTARTGAREAGSSEFDYEVQYLLDATESGASGLRARLARLGDSVVVVGTGEGTWNVHAHVNDVGAAIEAGVATGPTRRISVVRFADEQAEATRPGSAVVAVAPGPGMAHLFAGEGVCVVEGTAARELTIDDVTAAVRATGAAEIVLLPNASRVTGVAETAAERARTDGLRVTVVPTRSPVQGLAAVAVHDRARRFDDNVVAMAEAAAATRFAEITVARAQSLTSVGICDAGDVLGMIDGEVVFIAHDVTQAAVELVDRLLGVGGEIMTVLVGADAPDGLSELITDRVRAKAPLTDVAAYAGGQPDYPVIIGLE